MSTSTQQEIIDIAIKTYLSTNDQASNQYLKLRQESSNILARACKESKENGTLSPETELEIEKLKFEFEKISFLYNAYLERIKRNLEVSYQTPSNLNALATQVDELVANKEYLSGEVESLSLTKKPIVEKMRILAKNFENGISVKSGNSATLTSEDSEPDNTSTLIDYRSSVLGKSELEGLLDRVKTELASLKTVDEIGEEEDKKDQDNERTPEKAPSINIQKYLDALLQNSSAFVKVSEGQYHYDITKSKSVDVGTSSMALDDYDRAIESLTMEIQNLVMRGALAKERWMKNSRKVELIKTVLETTDDMEVC